MVGVGSVVPLRIVAPLVPLVPLVQLAGAVGSIDAGSARFGAAIDADQQDKNRHHRQAAEFSYRLHCIKVYLETKLEGYPCVHNTIIVELLLTNTHSPFGIFIDIPSFNERNAIVDIMIHFFPRAALRTLLMLLQLITAHPHHPARLIQKRMT